MSHEPPRHCVQPDFASTMLHVAHVAITQHWWKAMGRGQQVIVVHLAANVSQLQDGTKPTSGWNQPLILFFHVNVLLMIQKSQSQPPGMVIKPFVNNGINYQPQLVIAGFLPSTVSLRQTSPTSIPNFPLHFRKKTAKSLIFVSTSLGV